METMQHSPSQDEIAAVLLADDGEFAAAPQMFGAEPSAKEEQAPLELKPPAGPRQTPTACLERSSLLAHLGRHAEAIADCNRVLQLRAKVVQAHLLRGNIYLGLQRYTRAAADFTAALAIDPANSAAYHGRGLAQVESGQLTSALADFTEAIRLDPACAPAYANRGLLFQRTNEPEPALEDVAKAFLLDRSYALAYCHQLRLVHLARDQGDLAAADQALAALLVPLPGEAREDPSPSPFPKRRGEVPPPSHAGKGARGLGSKGQTEVRHGSRPAAETLIRSPAQTLGADRQTQSAKLRAKSNAGASSELAEYEKEQALVRRREQEREQEVQHARQRLQAEAARAREEERRRQQPKRRARKAGTNDDEEDSGLPRWKKGMLVAGVLVAFWWLGSHTWDRFKDHQARASLTAARVCKDFEADPDAARQKYAGNTFEVTGKVRVVNSPNGPRVLFHTPETAKCSIECLFPSKQTLNNIRTDQELTIEGECSLRPERGRTLIVLAECVVRSGL